MNLLLVMISLLWQGAQVLPNAPQHSLEIVDKNFSGATQVLQYYNSTGNALIKVKNNGTKVVTSVDWEVTLHDEIRKRVYDHFFFTSKKIIKPGKTEKLKQYFDYHLIPDYLAMSARIVKVTYADGTIWEMPKN